MPPPQHQTHRSNIRTRSQQQHQPIVPADLTASPLKAIRRQNRTATVLRDAGRPITTKPHPEQTPPIDTPISNAKRSPSPSSTSRIDDCKRQRVSVEKDEKETECSTSIQTSTEPKLIEVSNSFPLHLDLSRIPQSPSKPSSSPMKLFKITTHAEGTVEVPITPARRQTLNPYSIPETRVPLSVHSKQGNTELSQVSGQATISDNTLKPDNDIIPTSLPCQDPAAEATVTREIRDSIPPSSPSKNAATPAPTVVKRPESSVQFKTPIRPRETINAGFSRLPKPSSSFKASSLPGDAAKTPAKMPNPLAATISSLAKAKPRVSPMKLRSRQQLKMKLGIKDKTPTSKLALKRTIRRTSLNKEKLRKAPSPSTKPPGVSAGVIDKSTKGGKQTTLKSFFQRQSAVSERDPSVSNSPTKPAPLVALSTALKRLEVSAPLPPPRPSVGSGLAELTDPSESQVLVKETNTVLHGDKVTSDGCEKIVVVTEGSQTTPKARLPMRLPSNPDVNGRTRVALSNSPTNRKSPDSRTIIPPTDWQDRHDENKSTPKPLEIFDLEAWKENANERQKENKPPLEFFVPLADEPTAKLQALSQISPSRRASQASLALSQSLLAPNRPQIFPQARSVSASHVQLNARSPVKTRGKAKPPPAPEPTTQTNGKRLNARMPGSLDVLKNCVIYVDVRTEEGEDAAPLFVDMLRGLGARILSKPGKSCTHLVFKAGLPSTVVKFKLLPQPKPLVVSIGWVVECVEKRSHVDETRFQVNLDDIDITGGSQRRRSMTMQPKQIKALLLNQLDPGDSGDASASGDASFTSEGSSTTGPGLLNALSPPQRSVTNNLPPLERARQRSRRFPRVK